MNKIDWRDPESLRGISPAQALMVLGEITAALGNRKEKTETTDHSVEDRRLAAMICDSPEAIEFANAATLWVVRLRAFAIAGPRCARKQTSEGKPWTLRKSLSRRQRKAQKRMPEK